MISRDIQAYLPVALIDKLGKDRETVTPMGLFKLLTFPISGPMALAQVLRDEAERQLYDEAELRRQMAEVERQFQAGEIDGEEFEQREEALLERLLEAREYHRAKAEE